MPLFGKDGSFGTGAAAIGALTGLGGLGLQAATFAQRRPMGMRSLLTHAGVMAGAGLAVAGAGALMDHLAVQRSYGEMLKLYPELQRESPEKVRMYYDSISRSSPSVASNPLVAGSLIKRLINFDGFDHSVYRDLVDTQSKLDQRSHSIASNAISAMQAGLHLSHLYEYGKA